MKISKKTRDLVFIGGGHTHALVLRMSAMKPIENVQVTVISDATDVPYSGMLPGYLSGAYTYDETHIDIRALCEFAGAKFIHAKVTGIDREMKGVICEGRSTPIAYDTLSINIGSRPSVEHIRGAAEFAIKAKPVPQLIDGWKEIKQKHKERSDWIPNIVIVGAGAGGVELSMAINKGLSGRCSITLLQKENRILTTHAPTVAKKITQKLDQHKITVLVDTIADEITNELVILKGGKELKADYCFVVTQAVSHEWIKSSGFELDDKNFIKVRPTLQVFGDDRIFAAGDTATMIGNERPKSGVFAVRQAKPLLKNLRALIAGKELSPYNPQKSFMSLLNTSDGSAILSRKGVCQEGEWVWKLKDNIDRKFMSKFEDYPVMEEDPDEPMKCSGCAAKVPAAVLHAGLGESKLIEIEGMICDLTEADDAAVFTVPAGMAMIQSTDYMPTMMSDPYLFARIATLHSISDVYAMGGKMHSALLTLIVEAAHPRMMAREISQVMAGVRYELELAQAALIGGHTAEGETLGIGLACNGLVDPDKMWRKGGLEEGDVLILTKPLGVAMIFAAQMRGKCSGASVEAAIESMLLSNRLAVEALEGIHVKSATDITGFGLAGHLLEMASSTKADFSIDTQSLPILAGVEEANAANIQSSLAPENERFQSDMTFIKKVDSRIYFDPQTSGGLVIGVAQADVDKSISALKANGLMRSSVIGSVLGASNSPKLIIN
jgi:selenide, water dikinase